MYNNFHIWILRSVLVKKIFLLYDKNGLGYHTLWMLSEQAPLHPFVAKLCKNDNVSNIFLWKFCIGGGFETIIFPFSLAMWGQKNEQIIGLLMDNSLYRLFFTISSRLKMFQGWEPLYSGYGWWLMFERLWVRILVPYSGWTFGHFFHIDLLQKLYCLFEKTIFSKVRV